MSAERFPHSESELVAKLGLARKRVREVRSASLLRGDDWNHIGGQVRYSEAGQKKLRGALSIPPEGAPPAPVPPPPAEDLAPKKSEESPPVHQVGGEASQGKTMALQQFKDDRSKRQSLSDLILEVETDAAPKPGDERELVLVRKFLNRAIVQARLGKTLVRVRVKDSRKLVPGMFIRCQLLEKDLWKMTERLPRFMGKR